jgi:hypothetical protein
VILVAPFLIAFVQQTAALSGTVRQDSTLVPLPDIRVEVVGLTRAASSDARGHFVITGVPKGRWTVRASGIGYRSLELEVVLGDALPAPLDLHLVAEPVPISGLTVEVLRTRSIGPPRIKIEMETLAEVPALAAVDVLRALDVLPAVATVSEYSTALYVRGGTPDQTDILLDGFPVFNPYHLGGLYAAFSPDAVASVEMTPGAMPAALGSRMSSVVRVSTREGGADRVRGRGTFSLASAGFALDGPAPTGALPGAFVVSARHSFRGLTGGGISGEGIVPGNYRTVFHDAFAKWTLPLSGGALQPIWFTTSERIRLPDEHTGARHDWQWGSTLLGLSSTFALGQSARVEAKLASSNTRLPSLAGRASRRRGLRAGWARRPAGRASCSCASRRRRTCC